MSGFIDGGFKGPDTCMMPWRQLCGSSRSLGGRGTVRKRREWVLSSDERDLHIDDMADNGQRISRLPTDIYSLLV